MNPRLIARMDIKGSNLVKGIHLEGLRVLGKPEYYAKRYYEAGIDELLYMDTVATLYGRNSLLPIVEKTSREIFIPLTVGGGIRTLDDIRMMLRAGADKVALNTAAIQNPGFIREASRVFGSSTIVISIEAAKKPDGSYECYTDNGRVPTGLDAVSWAVRAAELGAGEILLTSIAQEGTGKGFDTVLTRKVSETVPVPVIASGGGGKLSDLDDVFHEGKTDAVALASMLHYRLFRDADKKSAVFTEGNTRFFETGEGYSRVHETTVGEIKEHLIQNGILEPELVMR